MSARQPREGLILLCLWLLLFVTASQFLVMVPILSDIGRALDIPEHLQGTLVSVYGVVSACFSLIAGPISDQVGRRRILLIGSSIMAGALLLHPLAHSFGSLLFMRALAGVASGFLSGASVAYVGDYFPYERRGYANGIIMSGFAAGQILGIPGGTVIAEQYGFAAPFAAFGAILVGVAAMIWAFVPQPDVKLESHVTVGGALRKFAGLLRHSDSLAATITFALMFFSVSSYVTFLPTWLEATYGLNKHQIASMYLVGGVAAVIGNPLSGRASDRFGRRGIVLVACVGLGLLQLFTFEILADPVYAWPLFFAVMTFASMRGSPLQSLVSQLVGPDKRGSLFGLTNATGSLGFASGSALSGLIYTQYGFHACAQLAAASCGLTALVIWRYLVEPKPGVVEQA